MFAKRAQKIIVVESSAGQFSRLLKNSLYGISTIYLEYQRPALGIFEEELARVL